MMEMVMERVECPGKNTPNYSKNFFRPLFNLARVNLQNQIKYSFKISSDVEWKVLKQYKSSHLGGCTI